MEDPEPRTVASIPDADLVERAVRSAGHRDARGPRWAHVAHAFALGSTFSAQLCVRFGLDPDELVGADPEPCPNCADDATEEDPCETP